MQSVSRFYFESDLFWNSRYYPLSRPASYGGCCLEIAIVMCFQIENELINLKFDCCVTAFLVNSTLVVVDFI